MCTEHIHVYIKIICTFVLLMHQQHTGKITNLKSAVFLNTPLTPPHMPVQASDANQYKEQYDW